MVDLPKRGAEWYLWKNIQQTALHLAQKVKDSSPALIVSSRPTPDAPIPPLDLPLPDNILDVISAYDLPGSIRHRLSDCLGQRVDDLRNNYQTRYRQACLTASTSSTFEHDVRNIRNAFQTLYRSQGIPVIKSLVESMRSSLEQRYKPLGQKPIFNHNFTPFLETYFRLNAYPSTSHKAVLAEKSMMTSRQIEVWFQNHRNRAKKEGKVLSRIASEAALHHALQISEAGQNEQHLLERDISDDDYEGIIHKSTTFISFERPSHAFPTPYPPPSSLDPFPTVNGRLEFPTPSWRRTPALHSSISREVIHMDELTTLFALKLNLREGPGKTSKKAARCHAQPTRRWFSSHINYLPSAPHPALIRPCKILHSSSSHMASLSKQHPLPAFSRTSFPSPTLRKRRNQNHRKEFPFPITFPPTRVTSVSQSLLEKQAPSGPLQSRSSSLSSLSSLSSNGPQTPPHSPRLLPPSDIVSVLDDGDSWFLEDIFSPQDLLPISRISYQKTPDPVLIPFYEPHLPTFSSLPFLQAQS